jgi:hypothetical protein
MNALRDLFGSERGFLALVLVIAATVLTGIGRMTVSEWQSLVVWIFGIYVSGKTVTGAIDALALKGAPAQPAPAPEAKP